MRPRGPWAAKAGAGVFVLAALAVGNVVNGYSPSVDEQYRPFLREGTASQVVDARSFTVAVRGVSGAGLVAASNGSQDSAGVWVVVTVRVTAVGEPSSVGYSALVDGSGREFIASGRVNQPLDGRTLQPGIPVEAQAVFEVPLDASGLRLRMAPSYDQRLDALAEIRLPVAPGDLAAWKKKPEPWQIASPKAIGGGAA